MKLQCCRKKEQQVQGSCGRKYKLFKKPEEGGLVKSGMSDWRSRRGRGVHRDL